MVGPQAIDHSLWSINHVLSIKGVSKKGGILMSTKIAWVVDEEQDSVANILSNDIKKGMVIPVTFKGEEHQIKVSDDIPYGHKIAIKPIKTGDTVVKYGLSIGRAIKDINVGEHVHIHNIEPLRGRGDLAAKGGTC